MPKELLQETPRGLVLIICDDVYTDKVSGKHVLAGVFNQICAQSFPCVHPKLCVFISLSEGHGDYEINLQITNRENGLPLLDLAVVHNFSSPLDIIDQLFVIRNLPIPSSGIYTIEVLCNKVPVMSRPFQIIEHH